MSEFGEDWSAASTGTRHDDSRVLELQAESALCGSVLLTEGFPNVTYERICAAGITPEKFHDPRHATVWQAFEICAKNHWPVDVHTVAAALRALDRLNAVGGAQFIGELTDVIPTVTHCDAHAELVMDAWRLRDAVSNGLAQVNEARNGEGTATERLKRVHALASKLPTPGGVAKASIYDHIDAWWMERERSLDALNSGKQITARFGVAALDGDTVTPGILRGIFRQNIVTIFGPPGSGKTTMAMQAAVETARDALALTGNLNTAPRVLYFATEMGGPATAMRLACAMVGVNFGSMRSGRGITMDEIKAVSRACLELASLPIDIIDSKINRGTITADDVHTYTSAVIARRGGDALDAVALVVVDYFQNLGRCRGMEKAGETPEQEYRAKMLHETAEQCNVPMIVVSSTTKEAQKVAAEAAASGDKGARGGEKSGEKGGRGQSKSGEAAMTDTRGAGLDFASDVYMGITSLGTNVTDTPGCVDVCVNIPKNRYGETGKVFILFDKKHGRFMDSVVARDVGMDASVRGDDVPEGMEEYPRE